VKFLFCREGGALGAERKKGRLLCRGQGGKSACELRMATGTKQLLFCTGEELSPGGSRKNGRESQRPRDQRLLLRRTEVETGTPAENTTDFGRAAYSGKEILIERRILQEEEDSSWRYVKRTKVSG